MSPRSGAKGGERSPIMPKPNYVERSALQCYMQPYHAHRVKLYGFILQGQIEALERLCDKFLNSLTPLAAVKWNTGRCCPM